MRGTRMGHRRLVAAIGGVMTVIGTTRAALSQTWDGGGANANWNTPSNWNPDALIANDGTANLTFAGNTRLSNTLDVDYSIRGLQFAATAGAFTIGPATRTLTIGAGGIDYSIPNGATQRINANLKLSADSIIQAEDTNDLIVTGDIDLNGHKLTTYAAFATIDLINMTYSGAITGAGSFYKDAYGELVLAGSAANSWTGTTTVLGYLGLQKTAGVNAVPGDVLVDYGNSGLVWHASNQIPDTATVQLGYGFNHLGAFSETIGDLIFGGGAGGGGGGLFDGTGTLTVAGGDVKVVGPGPALGTISCNFRLGALSTTMDVTGPVTTPSLIFTDTISQLTAGSGITKTGTGGLRIAVASTYTGPTIVQGGQLYIGVAGAIGSGALTMGENAKLVPETNMTVTNPIAITGSTTIATTGTSVITATGVISGTGTLTVSGFSFANVLNFSGSSANTNTGGLVLTKGTVTISKTAGLTALNGPIILGDQNPTNGTDATLNQTASNQIADASTITLHRDGAYTTNGFSESIASLAMSSGLVDMGTGTLTLLSGGITVPGHTESSTGLVNGKLSLTGQTRTFDVGVTPNASSGVGLTVNATILDGGINKTGAGRMNINSSANGYTGTTTVSGGGTLGIFATGSLGNEATTNSLILSNGTLAVTGGQTISTTRSLTLGTASFSAPGGIMMFAGSGNTTWLGQPVTVIDGQLVFARTGGTTTVTVGSSITVNPGATLNITTINALSDGTNHVNVINNGQLTVGSQQIVGDVDSTSAGAGNVTINGISLTANHIRQNNLTINVNNKAIIRPGGGNASVSTLNALSIGTSSSFDLANNKLIVHSGSAGATPTGSWNGSAYTDLTGFIAKGRNGNTTPLWDGSGIVTTQTTATTGNLTSIGIATAAQAGFSVTGIWAGQTVSASDTLIMYTYGGDANLDGKINIDDYIRIDNGIASAATGWANGDFNYDGVVNIDDYTTIIDVNIANQGAPFATGPDMGVGEVVAVPEPSGLALLLLGIGARRSRRGARSKQRR